MVSPLAFTCCAYFLRRIMKESPLYIGDTVKVVKSGLTKGKEAEIIENDSHEMDYKVEFDPQWIGYYNRKDLIIIQRK